MGKRQLIEDFHVPKPKPRPVARRTASAVPFTKPPDPILRKRKSRSKGKFVAGVLAVLVLIGGLGLAYKTMYMSKQTKTPSPPKVQAKAVETAPAPVDTVTIDSKVTAIIQRYPGMQISVAYKDLKTDAYLNTGVTDPYQAASIPKVLSAILFLQGVEKGSYTLDTPVAGAPARHQLRVMIENSDNPSWLAFIRLLGIPALDDFAKQTGMVSYDTTKNTSTPADIALLLEKLYGNELLNKENTDLLMSFMQNASEREYIPSALPAETKVYHKAGYLSDRAHDAAIIDDGKRPFVLVIFSKTRGPYDYIAGQQMMHEITAAVLSAY